MTGLQATADPRGRRIAALRALPPIAAGVAIAVLEVLGLGVLRRAWLNVDKVWAVAHRRRRRHRPHPLANAS